MNIRVGHVPYLNMVPFYHEANPQSMEIGEQRYEFWSRNPRALGLEARSGLIDAAPFSLIDALHLQETFEPIGSFGVGVKRCAQSVLLFSKFTFPLLKNAHILVTDETSTSSLLLQLLMEQRYQLSGVRFSRIASSTLWNNQADGMLLIGDEALKASQKAIPGLPIVTDLGEEWYRWYATPFVFARWMMRRDLPLDAKNALETYVERCLFSNETNRTDWSLEVGARRGITPMNVKNYWDGFYYRLTPEHYASILTFNRLVEQCLIA